MPFVTIGAIILGPNNEELTITDFLGRGAFGEVYRAQGRTSGRIVALKLLPLGSLASDEAKMALMNEMRAAQKVVHPNVVQVLHVHDGASSPVGPYVVMEYVAGGTLASLLRAHDGAGTQIPLDRAIEMMVEIVEGVRAINEKLIHRDIKPDNILLEDKRVKISDFGISKFVDESTRLHTFKGGQHIAYMAPEGWQDQANTFKLDVYSVGLVFYQILALKHPLLDNVKDPTSFLDWERAHLYGQCPDIRTFRREVPPAIAQLLSRMVSKRPQERPSWDEVLKILGEPGIADTVVHPSVLEAVEAAIARKQEEQKRNLQLNQQQAQRQRQLQLYRYACDTLLQELNTIIEEFNRRFQHGQITCRRDIGSTIYHNPAGHNIEVTFFEPRDSGIRVRGGEIVGGGWLGISEGRSANLVLLREGSGDLYGRWVVCEIGIMALADPHKLLGQFGLTERTVVPFGFKDAYFYDQMRYAAGGLHVFTYTFTENVRDFFGQLLVEACK